MFMVTNREVDESQTTIEKAFSSRLNKLGANELRIAEVTKSGRRWSVRILPDQITKDMASEVGIELEMDPETNKPKPIFASRYVARKIVERVNPGKGKGGVNLLFFVHGFNNDVKSVVERAERLQKEYGVEVIPFSWPANGGGARGVASYKSDKRDALASTGALDRTIARAEELLDEIHREHARHIERDADDKYADDAEKWDRYFSAATRKWCPFKISLMLHSMGNYVFKHLLGSTVYRGDRVVFDNVILVAADTNNEDHSVWVDKIQCRGRVYITINENDSALSVSRLKLGEQQKARLGHYPFRLDSRQAVYVDFTNQSYVTDSHAYFEGQSLRNVKVKGFFHDALNGAIAESDFTFDVGRNMYRPGKQQSR